MFLINLELIKSYRWVLLKPCEQSARRNTGGCWGFPSTCPRLELMHLQRQPGWWSRSFWFSWTIWSWKEESYHILSWHLHSENWGVEFIHPEIGRANWGPLGSSQSQLMGPHEPRGYHLDLVYWSYMRFHHEIPQTVSPEWRGTQELLFGRFKCKGIWFSLSICKWIKKSLCWVSPGLDTVWPQSQYPSDTCISVDYRYTDVPHCKISTTREVSAEPPRGLA